MESDQVEMYQISKSEQSNNKENVVLRTLVGDPNRHKPLAQHPSTAKTDTQEPIPASMYTLDTRYRPIPQRVLPKSMGTTLHYIDSQNVEQTSVPNPPIIKEEPVVILPAEQEVVKHIEEEQPQSIIFLEPKIISQPVLYSIVSAKTLPIPNDQPIPINQEMSSPILYAITGHHHRPTIDMSASTVNVEKSVTDKSPILYTLVGNPRLQVRFQEPVKQVSQIPKQSTTNHTVIVIPHHHEPVKQIPKQPLPTLYSIVGNPILIPHIKKTNILDPPHSIKPAKVSSLQPVPILYTIVGETQVPNHTPEENRPPLAPIKTHTTDGTMYTVIGDPRIPQSMKNPRKTQPLQQQQQAQIPLLYPLVGKPKSLPEENTEIRLKPIVRRKSPSTVIVSTRRISRSLERQRAPEPVIETVTTMPLIKNKRQSRLKEPTIPKSETVFFPLPEHERVPRPKKPRTIPWYTSPEQGKINHKSFQIARYDPLRPADYISPYAYHPAKPYREQTLYPTLLPSLTNNRSERKSRPPLYDPRYLLEQKHAYDPRTYHSLERDPFKLQQPFRLWDYEDQAQTDPDDDNDNINGSGSSRKKQRYRRYRPRTPWEPVW